MKIDAVFLIFFFLILAAGMVTTFIAGLWSGRRQRFEAEEGAEGLHGQQGAAEEMFLSGLREGSAAGEADAQASGYGGDRRPEASGFQKHEERHAGEGYARKRNRNGECTIANGKAVGSPCGGEVNFFYEGSRRGAVILPAQGMVYAPASGKIIRVYPMGNAFLLRTDFGAELLLKVGSKRDELLSTYYRPRIVQNEIVHKGKLLLEFDLEGLQAEGEDTAVSVSVEASDDREVLVTGQKQVKVGEALLWVREKKERD